MMEGRRAMVSQRALDGLRRSTQDFRELRHRMRGQVLRYFAYDALRDFRMQRLTQIAEEPGSRDDDELVELLRVLHFVERGGDFGGKTLFGAVMPIRFADRGTGHAIRTMFAARPVGALLARR